MSIENGALLDAILTAEAFMKMVGGFDGDAIEQHLDVSQCQKVFPTSDRDKVQDGDLDRGVR
jgi:hypothetical protein